MGCRVTALAGLANSPTSSPSVNPAVMKSADLRTDDNMCSPRIQAGIPDDLIGNNLELAQGHFKDFCLASSMRLNSPKIGRFLGV
jgi:hypothetical protein